MPQIDIAPLFSGVAARGATKVTISGTMSSPGAVCADLQVSLSCPASQSSVSAVINSRTGDWTAKLATKCDCGTDLVTVVASCPALGFSGTSVGPIVCYVDWHKRSVVDRMIAHRWMVNPRQFLAIDNFGSCRKCIAVSLTLFALSLLVFSAGSIIKLPIVTMIGLLATTAFGSLVGLHAIFFFLKRQKVVVQQPQKQQDRRCCGS